MWLLDAEAQRCMADKQQLFKTWQVIVGTATVISAFWLFFLTRELSIRDKQIEYLRESSGQVASAEVISRIDRSLAMLSLATAIDPIDGRIQLGSGVSTGSRVTTVLIDIAALVEAQQFDLIEAKLAEIEQLYPDFPGSIMVRFEVAKLRGFSEDADRYANELIAAVSNDKRIVPALLFAAEQALQREERTRAERLALDALSLDPENEQLAERFEEVFGYSPAY